MTALSYDRVYRTGSHSSLKTRRYLMKPSTQIWAGALVMLNTSGTVEPASASPTGRRIVGVALERKLSGASGETFIEVGHDSIFPIARGAIGPTDVGRLAYASTDDDISTTRGANELCAGVILEVVDRIGAGDAKDHRGNHPATAFVYVSPVFDP